MSNEITVTKKSDPSPFNLTTFQEAERFAKMIADSDLAPKDFKGKPGNVLVAIQMGYELGLKPMQAIQNIAVVNGRPQIWGDAALALVKNSPRCRGIREWITGSIKSGDAKAFCEVKRLLDDGSIEITTKDFSTAQAMQAGLLTKAGTWSQYPERMLQMRARGFALRDSFPDVLKGVYIEGEMDGAEEIKVVEQKEQPKLGVEAVKQSITKKAIATIEAEVININQETGEISAPTFDEVKIKMENAKTVNNLIDASDAARSLTLTKEQRDDLAKIYTKKQSEVK
jgi:hypothetical protein